MPQSAPNDHGRKLAQAVSLALSVARRGRQAKADGGPIEGLARQMYGMRDRPVDNGPNTLSGRPEPGLGYPDVDAGTNLALAAMPLPIPAQLARFLPMKADGGEIADTPVIGPLGSNLETAMRYAPAERVAALTRLSHARSFPDVVAANPRGWGAQLPPEPIGPAALAKQRLYKDAVGEPDFDIPMAIGKGVGAVGKMYGDQFGHATDAVADAFGDPSLNNVVNAGVQTGMTIGSPALTVGSGLLGFGAAGAKDLASAAFPEVEAREARSRKQVQPYGMKPTIMEPPVAAAPAEHDDLADKVKGDPQLELLYHAYTDAVKASKDDVGGGRISQASGNLARHDAANQAQQIMGQISTALEKREQAKRDIQKSDYDRQVSDAVNARDTARSRDKRFADTYMGKLYDKIGVAPVLAGMVPGAVMGFARGPAQTLKGELANAATGFGFGAGAAMAPDIYNNSQAPASNPEKEAMNAYAFNLPDTHPDKAKAKAYADSLPDLNPVQQAAKQNLFDPQLLGERVLFGGAEGAGGAHIAQYFPGAVGGALKPSTYGIKMPSFGRGAATDLETGVGSKFEPSLPSGSATAKPLDLEGPSSTGTLQPMPPSPGQSGLELAPPTRAPEIQKALNVAKAPAEAAPSSAEFSPDDLASQKASEILKHFRAQNVKLWRHGDREVPRRAPGSPEGGQIISQDEFKALTSKPKGKAKSSTKPDDSTSVNDPSSDLSADQVIKPPVPFDDPSRLTRGQANGGVTRGLLGLARRYAMGGMTRPSSQQIPDAPDANSWASHAVGPLPQFNDPRMFKTPSALGTENLLFDRNAVTPEMLWDATRDRLGNPSMQKDFAHGGAVRVGAIVGPTGGRTDALPVSVPAGAFVLPADFVSYFGENNSLAGAKHLEQMFGPQNSRAAGGAVPIKISDGEFVISPEKVAEIGGGNLEQGHRILDKWVLNTRAEHIKSLQQMPAPSR